MLSMKDNDAGGLSASFMSTFLWCWFFYIMYSDAIFWVKQKSESLCPQYFYYEVMHLSFFSCCMLHYLLRSLHIY